MDGSVDPSGLALAVPSVSGTLYRAYSGGRQILQAGGCEMNKGEGKGNLGQRLRADIVPDLR